MNRKLHFGSALIAFLAVSMSVWAQGDVLWKKNFGGAGPDIYYSVTEVLDGIIAVGTSYITSFGTGDWADITGKGVNDAVIVKYDNDGNVIWKKNFGGKENDYYYSVTTVPDGIIAVGYSDPYSFGQDDWAGVMGKGGSDAIIVKYDNNGNVVWKKNFGGSWHDCYYSVTAVSDGVVAVGYSWSQSFGSGDWAGVTGKGIIDAIIVKHDNNGNVVWKKNFGGNRSNEYNSITAVSDGVVAVGYSSSSSFGSGDWTGITGKGYDDAIIVKYNHNGNVVWKKNFGGSDDDCYNSVTAVSDGVVVVGQSESFGNGDWEGIIGKGNDDAIIVKYDNDGNVVWKKNFGGSKNDRYFSITAVPDGVVAVGGSVFGSFGNGDWEGVEGKGYDDAIIVKYDNDGNVIWKKNFGGSDTERFRSVMVVSDGIVTVGDSYLGSFGNGDWIGVTGKGTFDAIIVKYSTNPTSITDNPQDATLRIYPNPTNGQLHITGFDGTDAIHGVCTDAQIFDVYGRKVLVVAVETHGRASLQQQQHPTTTLDISHLPDGVYFLRIGGKTTKIVKINNN